MIASSRTLKLAAAGVALAAHAAVALVVIKEEPVLVEGSAGAAEVRLGNSFRELVQNEMKAVEVEDVLEDTAPEETLKPTPPEKLEALKPVVTAPDVIKPQVLAALPAPLKAEVPKPETVKAQEPKPKPKETKKKPKPKAKKQAAKTQTATKKKSRATRETVGAADGKKTAKATSKGGAGKGKTAGNAKVSNYPGKVHRKLARVRKPSMRERGAAVVIFTIAANGGLSRVAIARSSGSAKLDKATLKHVRRAVPFPKPPAGAKRNFEIKITWD